MSAIPARMYEEGRGDKASRCELQHFAHSPRPRRRKEHSSTVFQVFLPKKIHAGTTGVNPLKGRVRHAEIQGCSLAGA